jgi:1,4-alpha-glucan branching enzyme
MILSQVLAAQYKFWKDFPEVQALQLRAEHATAEEKLPLLAQLADHRSQKIFQAARPPVVNSETKELEAQRQALVNFYQVCQAGDSAEIKTQFYKLPKKARGFLFWAIWIVDSLEKKPLRGANHSQIRFDENPKILIAQNAKKVIHMKGDSLVEQLLHCTTDALAVKYQELNAANLSRKHPEQKKLSAMRMATDLAQYDQITLLKPLLTTSDQRSTFENYLSARVLSWLNTPPQAPAVPQAPQVPQVVRPSSELYDSRGAHQKNGKTTFCVYAPNAQQVQCLLTNPKKVEKIVEMQKQSDGTWTASIDQLSPGKTYLYRVKDCHGKTLDRVDPFSFGNVHVSQTNTMHSVVVDRNNFVWKDAEWVNKRVQTNPLQQPLSIYEVHIKSWADKKKNLRELAPLLAAHCQEIGFTHIEPYGIMEHFWGRSRGYQVTNFFAPYHDVGSYDDMKFFVDVMHRNGLGVIIDWIPAHYDYGHAGSRHLGASMYQFDGTDLLGGQKSNWGTVYVDYSRPEAQRLMEASALWWLNEFHLDGLRVDAVSPIANRAGKEIPAGIEFLGKLNEKIHATCPGVLMIAEATDWDPRIWKPAPKGFGFDLNWAVGAGIDLGSYLKTPENERKAGQHQGKLERIFNEGQRSHEKKIAVHSHDDVDHHKPLYRLGQNHSSEAESLSDIRSFFAWQIFGPNWGHLFHMGDEFAQPESWYARVQKGQSGMQWEYLQKPAHNNQKKFLQDAIRYYKAQKGFWEQGGANSKLLYSHANNSVIAYARDKQVVVHNFSNKGYHSYGITLGARFKGVTHLEEKLNSDAAVYGGSGGYLNGRVALLQGGLKAEMKLPPRSAVVLG